jgi:predicted permease
MIWPRSAIRTGPLGPNLTMSPQEIKFVLFWVVSLSSLAFGYMARKRRWVHEDASRDIHYHTVVWVWSLSSLLGVWKSQLSWQIAWFVPVVFGSMFVTTVIAAWLAGLMRFSREQTGTLAIGGGIANTGATMGLFICYSLIRPPHEALGVASVYTATQGAALALIGNATARHYGHTRTNESILKLFARTMFDMRALGFYAATLGLVLSVSAVPQPRQIVDWHILDAILFTATIGAHVGIGLRLRLRIKDLILYRWHNGLMTLMRFVVTPALALLLLWLINLTPLPLSDIPWRVAMMENCMPAGITMVVLSNLFRLDTRLAGSAWFWNFVCFLLFVLPVMVIASR